MTTPERRRRARRAVETSDVTRFRAFGAAAIAFVLTVVGLLALRGGPSALVTPGPLARPHAGLECASCHEGDGEERATSACGGCHGPHPSARAAHAALAQSDELDCATCHAVHRSENGLAFEPDGEVVQYGTGLERRLGRSSPLAATRENASPVFVPLVSREACGSCHDLERSSDPAWSCFGRQGGEADGYSLCFDEHRRPAEARGARSAERDAVVERARELAPRVPRERLASALSGGATIAAGALVAGFVVAFARRRLARKRRRRLPVVAAAKSATLPIIDATRCLGCQGCVDACPYDVLEMSRYVAVVSRPEQCCGAGSCLTACPNGSLSLRDGPDAAGEPRFAAGLAPPSVQPGVRFAGDVTGGSLIRTALEQGVRAARAVAEELGSPEREPGRSAKLGGTEGARVDLVVVGAGPAGLAAGLEAKRRGVGVVVLEQASIAESIRRYSREKLVLDSQPSASDDLPLFIADSTKEELLRRWLREVRARGLDVREGARVVRIESSADGAFSVHAVDPSGASVSIPCRRVVVATGRRGSPRKLAAAVPEAVLGRVHYELSDARTFAGSRAVVVGLGDVAMETALALALVPGTSVTIVHRGGGFSRGRQTNIERIGRRVAEGRIGIVFDADVRAIGLERIVVSTGGSERTIAYDALFVHIGAEAKAVVPITSGRR